MQKLIGIAALALIAIAGYWFYQKGEIPASPSLPEVKEGSIVITLSEDGFSPAEVRVMAGETVTFKTTAGKPFWPASNTHPSHTLYPEFDPEKPVQPGDSWSFVASKPGTWGYHDHLAPYYTGTLIIQ